MKSRAVRFAIRCYESLLWLYPREFRCKHAAEMACVFAESCEAEWRARGNRALGMLAASTLHDLIVSAAAERVSVFITELKWDKRMLAGTPGFRAASAIIFTICFSVVGMFAGGALNRLSPWQRGIFLAEMCLNVGILWAASLLLPKAARARSNWFASSVSFEKLRAFRHLSGAALKLLVLVTAAALIPALKAAAHGLPRGHMPPLSQCAMFPVLLLLLVLVFFVLDPLLSANSAGEQRRSRHRQLRAG